MTAQRAPLWLAWAIGAVFLAIGIERALRALAIAGGPDLPALLFASVLVEAVGALVAAIGLFGASRVATIGLALFVGAALVHLGADVLIYHIRAVVEAAAIALCVLALAAIGWFAQTRPPVRAVRVEVPT
jgi:hypothetical protein